MRKPYILGLIGLAAISIGLAWADEITFTTYYPAPYGVYNDMVVMNSLGIGTTNPQAALHVAGDNKDVYLDSYSSSGSGWKADLEIRRARGTESAPGIVLSNTNLGSIRFMGWDGSDFKYGAQIRAMIDGTPGAGDIPTRLEFHTTPDGSDNRQIRMTIKEDGNVGIGATSPGAPLEIEGDGDTSFIILDDTTGSLVDDVGIFNNGQIFAIRDESDNATLLAIRLDGSNQGNVGIGTVSPGYLLTVNGEPAANGYTLFTDYSDMRLKDNITPLDNVLDKIKRLKPCSYNYKELTGYDKETQKKKFVGFIGQELQTVFPEMVGETTINGQRYLDSNKSGLQIYLVKAIQEQQGIIEELQVELIRMKEKVDELESFRGN